MTARSLRSLRRALRWLLVIVYVAAGVMHFAATQAVLSIVPGWVPFPLAVVWLTGLCELAGAAGLVWRRTRAVAGILLALYAVAVYPANVHHALAGIVVPGLPSSWWYHGPRLAFQPVLVWWALFAGAVIDWPFRRSDPPC